MKDKKKQALMQKALEWQAIIGANPKDYNRASKICQAEWQEYFNSSKKQKPKEAGDCLFTALWLNHCIKAADTKVAMISTLRQAIEAVDNQPNGWKWFEAVVDENYSKLLPTKDFPIAVAALETDEAIKASDGRYKAGKIVRRGDFYVLFADEYNSEGKLVVSQKVIKPSTYKPAAL